MRLYKPTRESFIPKGSVKFADKQSDAVAYVYEEQGSFYAAVFFGKQAKPVAHYRYRTAARREANVLELFASRRARCEMMNRIASERKAWVNDYKVGEIVNTCWGYDQTNREFYQIIAVKGKRVTIRQIASKGYATGWAQEQRAPMAGEFCGEPKVCFASERGIKTGRHSFTYATRTRYTETVPGVKVYETGHVSSYA